jgi:hypothetical protein
MVRNPLSAIRDFSFNVFVSTLLIWSRDNSVGIVTGLRPDRPVFDSQLKVNLFP